MTGPAISDPLAMVRAAVDQWEKLANEFGADLLKRPETTQAMQKMTAGYLQMQKLTQEAMDKALAAANIPSRSDIEAIGARLGAIEASLARLEAHAAPVPVVAADPPRPPRTRKPPQRS